ncbi:lipid droplet-associated protein [Kibdelosporangium lantanae]
MSQLGNRAGLRQAMRMTSLPLPLRVAAGLAATAIERARELPEKIAGLPVTVASQAMQLSMRVQQEITALAIKGDEALAAFRPVEDSPEWATFDEDTEQADAAQYDMSRSTTNGRAPDPWEMEESAIAEAEDVPPPAGLPNYDELSLPQLRARLRSFTLPELEDLLRYEEANAARPSFIGMLTRRIASVSAATPTDPQSDSQ